MDHNIWLAQKSKLASFACVFLFAVQDDWVLTNRHESVISMLIEASVSGE